MPHGTQIVIRKSSCSITGRARCRGGVELAVTRAVQEAFPLVLVEHEYPLVRVARHPHQDPLRAIRAWAERDFDRAVAMAGAVPGLRSEVDAQVRNRGLGGIGVHGFLATPQ